MRVRIQCAHLAILALLVLAPTYIYAQDGFNGALKQLDRTSFVQRRTLLSFESPLVIADLDSDNKPDGAVLLSRIVCNSEGSSREIELHFTNRPNVELIFQSAETALSLAGVDIDHDGDIDLVVEQPITHKPLQVWINDGRGEFKKGRVEDYAAPPEPTGTQVQVSEELSLPAVSLPSQRCSESLLKAGHISGRPPSRSDSLFLSALAFQQSSVFHSTATRAPPLSHS